MNDLNFWHSWFGVSPAPSIIVVGLQEVIGLDSKRANAKLFLGNGETSRYSQWVERMKEALFVVQPGARYKLMISQSLVGLHMAIFVREDQVTFIGSASCDAVKTGLGGYHGNKGSLVGRIIYRDSSLCFINAHLAAGHDKVASRNSDAGMIIKTAKFVPATVSCSQVFTNGGEGSSVEDMEHCFFFGDLNYRIDCNRSQTISMIQEGNFELLAKYDQITYQLGRNHHFPLSTFCEGQLNFPPTYKFDPQSHEYDTSEKMRVPSWCDRILYRCSLGLPSLSGTFERYDSIRDALHSDHRPIHALIRIKIRSVNPEKYQLTKSGLINL